MQVLSLSAAGFQLVLPVNMVAQIIGVQPVTEAEHKIRGMSGTISWREFTVPLIQTSELLTGRSGLDKGYERIVVIWPLKSDGPGAFFSLTSMGPPRVLEVEAQQAMAVPEGFDYCMSAMQVGGLVSLIPDMQSISTSIFNQNDP